MENICKICPRNCGIDRSKNLGFCKSSNKLKVAKVMLHYFEEPPISGTEINGKQPSGSGAIFFSGCNLRCCFCQNNEISHECFGKEISIETLADIFRQLEAAGAYNINLVTPTHYANQIIESLKIYRPKIPVIWNTSGYEKPETIKRLKDYVDIYLADFKYFDSEISKELSLAEDYPKMCKNSILQMRKNQPKDIFKKGLMKKGLIVRHLVLPNCTNDSKNILNWIEKNLGKQTYVSIMSQYVPMAKAKENQKINRKIKPIEYKVILNFAEKLGLINSFVQDLTSAEEIYTPNFKEPKTDFDF